MTDLDRLVRDALPGNPSNLREDRYLGDAFDLGSEELAPGEQAALARIYADIQEVYRCWLEVRDLPLSERQPLLRKVIALDDPSIRNAADSLGSSVRRPRSSRVTRILHDVRGGALTALLANAQLLRDEHDPVKLRSAALLARDHAKMMRNALPWIDPAGRALDEQDRPHRIDDLVGKWSDFRFPGPGGTEGQVHVEGLRTGLLAARCLEASAVDRVLYNLMNNAIRFAAGPDVRLAIHRNGSPLVRWIVANEVSDEQAGWIREQTGDEPSRLMLGGVTRGGSGIGLANCVDFIVSAFGLPDVEAAIEGGHTGTLLAEGYFVAWFHWPALDGDAADHPNHSGDSHACPS